MQTFSEREIHQVVRLWRAENKERDKLGFGVYNIIDNMINHKSNELIIHNHMLLNKELPVPFFMCKKLSVSLTCKLKSFKNFPLSINGLTNTQKNRHPDVVLRVGEQLLLTSLEGFPKTVNGGVDLSMCKMMSYEKSHKHFDYIRALQINSSYVGPLLSLMLVDSLEAVYVAATNTSEIGMAVGIINTHLASEERDIIDCQQDLIDNGLKKYASL